MPKFSICTPVTFHRDDPDNVRQPRYEMFLRCANSVFSQTFTDFEWVIADDMSEPHVEDVLKEMSVNAKDYKITVVRLPEKSGRIAARNLAMKHATGEWLTWLDGDDEYASTFLQMFNDAIRLWPDYKVFNMNHLIFHYDYNVTVRQFLDVEKLEGRPFGSGTIGAGSYIFHRDVYNEIGPMPELGLWDFSEAAFVEFPEIKPFFLNGTNKEYNSLGNPWGEDYYYFYKMTRKHPSKYLNTALYYVHSHFGHRFHEDENYAMGEPKGISWNKHYQ